MKPALWVWGLAFLSVGLSALCQIALKLAVGRTNVVETVAADPWRGGLSIALNPWLIVGLAAYGVSFLLWLVCLSKMPLSAAYPLVSLGIVMVLMFSVGVLGEHLTAARLVGVSLIVVGVVLLGRG